MLESRQNHSITSVSLPVIESLNRLAANSNMLDLIRNDLSKARASLKFDPLLKVAVEVLDPAIIRQIVPEIGSARLVAIRDGFDSGIESHPNSTQYLFSLEGSGETHDHSSRSLLRSCLVRSQADRKWNIILGRPAPVRSFLRF